MLVDGVADRSGSPDGAASTLRRAYDKGVVMVGSVWAGALLASPNRRHLVAPVDSADHESGLAVALHAGVISGTLEPVGGAGAEIAGVPFAAPVRCRNRVTLSPPNRAPAHQETP